MATFRQGTWGIFCNSVPFFFFLLNISMKNYRSVLGDTGMTSVLQNQKFLTLTG